MAEKEKKLVYELFSQLSDWRMTREFEVKEMDDVDWSVVLPVSLRWRPACWRGFSPWWPGLRGPQSRTLPKGGLNSCNPISKIIKYTFLKIFITF